MREVRLALRTLLKAPLFTGIAGLSLALGIGANTAMFGLVDQILLRLLPVQNPRELVQLTVDPQRREAQLRSCRDLLDRAEQALERLALEGTVVHERVVRVGLADGGVP